LPRPVNGWGFFRPWQRRTNVWRKKANPARAPTRLTERSNPATARNQWLALCEDAFHPMKKLAAPMKSFGNLILMTLMAHIMAVASHSNQ
jgi:hypothetical protein